MKNKLYAFFILVLLLTMTLFPKEALEGSTQGLLLWFHTVLPTLLPFIILTGILIRLDGVTSLTRFIHPFFQKTLHLSPSGCYALICGLLCGYPMGAKTTAQLLKNGKLELAEAQFLLGICNNVSPAFFLNYVMLQTLRLSYQPLLVLSLTYGVTFLYGMATRPPINGRRENTRQAALKKLTFEMLDDSIMDGFETITRLGGYIIMFGIIAKMATARLPAVTILKILLIGLLEITNGCRQVQASSLPPQLALPLVLFLCSLGGLCGLAQTKSMIQGTDLSLKKYVGTKLCLSLLIMLTSLLLPGNGSYS